MANLLVACPFVIVRHCCTVCLSVCLCVCVGEVYEFYTQRGSTALPSDFAASSASPAAASADAAPVTPTPLPTAAAAAMFQHRHVVWRARFAIRLYEIMDGAEFNVVSMEKGTAQAAWCSPLRCSTRSPHRSCCLCGSAALVVCSCSRC